jgi:hypothetical protein
MRTKRLKRIAWFPAAANRRFDAAGNAPKTKQKSPLQPRVLEGIEGKKYGYSRE